ncbi:MAG: quinolinate synthase NadA, partial [Candidatus Adiutrix sp.]|nr:quinolinate synthase NadA [Candidatus Adiutrix sp.]
VLAGRHKVDILAHFYQRAEIKAVADFVGGSYEVVEKALAAGPGRRVLICGASFMVEAAQAGRPRAEIWTPRTDLSCPLAEAVGPEAVEEARRRFPRARVVVDLKARPEIRALADLEISPATAAERLSRLAGAPILALPGPQLVDWAGFGDQVVWRWPRAVCQVHELATADDLAEARDRHPGAPVAVNLLCRPEVRAGADFVGDSAGLGRFCAESPARDFIIVSEAGLAEFLTLSRPDKNFHETEAEIFCPNMKLTNLKAVIDRLKTLEGGGEAF